MKDNRDRHSDEALGSLLKEFSRPDPDPAFRERNRRMFTGEIPYETRDLSRFETMAPVRRIWGGLGLAAAAALAVVFLVTGNAPRWQVSEAVGVGPVLVNGNETAAQDLPGRKLSPDTRIRSCDMGSVTLEIPEAVTLVLGSGAEATLGASRSPLGAVTLTARVHRGMTLGSTGPGFPSGGLQIETDLATVRVWGTTFAVECAEDTTCVCVLTGSVEVEFKDGRAPASVPPEHQLFIPLSGASSSVKPMSEIQRERLVAVRQHSFPGN